MTGGEGMTLAGEVEQHLLPTGAIHAGSFERMFEQLIDQHEPQVRRLAYRLLGWRDEAVEDIVQDVFLTAFDHIHRFRGESSIQTWLTRVTVNRCRSLQRKRWIRLTWLRRQRPAQFHRSAAEEVAVREETSSRVRTAIQSLGTADREIIVLFHLEDLSSQQIAELLGLSPNAVDVRLHRARQRLKLKLHDLVTP